MQTRRRFTCFWRHPVLTFLALAFLGPVSLESVRHLASLAQLQASNNPLRITDWALSSRLTSEVADQEIRDSLADGSVDVALGIVALATERDVPIEPDLVQRVTAAAAAQRSVASMVGRVAHGFLSGDSDNGGSLAGSLAADLFCSFGDFRDLAQEGMNYLSGKTYDPWTLAVAGGGIALTLATYETVGAVLPERIGLSLLKVARRMGRLNPRLALRLAGMARDASALFNFAESLGIIEAHAGVEAVFDSLSLAETPEDVMLLSRLATAKGRETRAVLRLLGHGAYRLAQVQYEFVKWLVWAILAWLGFCATCKAMVERMTEQQLLRKKLRRAAQGLTKPT